MEKRPLRYHSLILTFWQEAEPASGCQPAAWRFRLEDPHTSEKHGFKSVAELLVFLEAWTAVPPPEDCPIEK